MANDAQLVSMKLPPREKSDAEVMYPSEGASPDAPEYPWGVRLHLDEAQLKALGITDLPKTGTSVSITAKGDICSTSEYESQDKGVQRSIDIQITDLGIG